MVLRLNLKIVAYSTLEIKQTGISKIPKIKVGDIGCCTYFQSVRSHSRVYPSSCRSQRQHPRGKTRFSSNVRTRRTLERILPSSPLIYLSVPVCSLSNRALVFERTLRAHTNTLAPSLDDPKFGRTSPKINISSFTCEKFKKDHIFRALLVIVIMSRSFRISLPPDRLSVLFKLDARDRKSPQLVSRLMYCFAAGGAARLPR